MPSIDSAKDESLLAKEPNVVEMRKHTMLDKRWSLREDATEKYERTDMRNSLMIQEINSRNR